MKLSDHIHWSFQYDGRSQTPHFGKQLIEILNRGTTSTSKEKYTVLPNYWKGYKGRGGGDPERIGLEQIFDLRNDPGETQNLAYDENKRTLLMQYREALLNFEAGLERRQITHERPTRQIGAWGTRIRAHWDAHPELEAMRILPKN